MYFGRSSVIKTHASSFEMPPINHIGDGVNRRCRTQHGILWIFITEYMITELRHCDHYHPVIWWLAVKQAPRNKLQQISNQYLTRIQIKKANQWCLCSSHTAPPVMLAGLVKSPGHSIGRSPQRRFPDHAFMPHCTFFPHLLAQQGVRCTPEGEGALTGGIS